MCGAHQTASQIMEVTQISVSFSVTTLRKPDFISLLSFFPSFFLAFLLINSVFASFLVRCSTSDIKYLLFYLLYITFYNMTFTSMKLVDYNILFYV